MSIKLSDSIRVGQQKPLEDKYFNELVPYTSITQVNTLLPKAVRHIGLTVNINGEEYWYKDGIEDANLVLKVPNIDTSNLVPYTGANKDVNIASNYFKTSKGFDFTKDADNYFRTFHNGDYNYLIFYTKDNSTDNFGKVNFKINPEEGIVFQKYSDSDNNTFQVALDATYSFKKFVTDEGYQILNGTATQALRADGGVFDLNTKADLENGKVPASQLPAYVDDVLEFANLASFPATGENGKIYIAIDTNLTYRWGGSSYVVMSSSLALGETSSTAYRGDRGKIAYDHSQTTGNPHGTTKNDIGLGNVDNTSDLNKPISTATQQALNNKQDILTNPVTGTGTTNYLPKFTASGIVGNSKIFDDGTNVGVGTVVPSQKLTVLGADNTIPALGGNGGKLGLLNGVSGVGTYGLIQGVLGNGSSYFQVQRVDGVAVAYNLLLQPNGGNVGIGEILPIEKLEVNGYVKATGFKTPTGAATQALTADGGVFDLNTKADLVSGKVPASQLPAYVDDVLEFANLASFPATGENGKIYIAIDTNLTYRWGGSSYVVMSSSLALGETPSTAYRGDRGKIAYDHSQATGNPHNTKVEELTDIGNETTSIADTDIILKKESGGLWKKITFANFKNWFTNELAKKINIGVDTFFNFKNISAMTLTEFRGITPNLETIYFTEEQNGSGWQQIRYNGLFPTVINTTETKVSFTNENYIELDSDSTFNLIDVANTKINGIFEKDFVIIKYDAGVETPSTPNQWFKVILKINNVQVASSPIFYLTEPSGTIERISHSFALNVPAEMVTHGATLHLKTSLTMTFNKPAISVIRVHKSTNANI